MKRKLCSVLLALCMVLTLLPVSAMADDGAPAGESTPAEVPAAETEYVAQIGNQGYATLAEAVEAAKSGDTITLLQNVELTVKNGTSGTLCPQMEILNKNITLDLATHSIGYSSASKQQNVTGTPAIFAVGDSSVLTVTGNGTIDSELGNNGSYAFNVNGGVLSIQNGSYTGAPTAIQVQTGSATICDGHFALAETINKVQSSYSKYLINCIDANFKNGSAKVTILGGTFVSYNPGSSSSENPTANFIPTGYSVTESSGTYTVTKKADNCAAIGSIEYSSVADAVSAAKSGDTITLLKDTNEDVTIPAGATVTLDLNGHKLTNASGHTITNNGNLTVTGSGTVDNITHAKAALYNNTGATATLNGGTFDRSHEAGSAPNVNGGNSYYTLKNFGTMTINAGVTVQQDGTANGGTSGKYSSLIANGWQNANTAGQPNKEPAVPEGGAVLTINGGSFKGGLNTIKNDDDAVLTINGGTFTNYTQAAFQNHGTAAVNGGTFTADSLYSIDNCGCDATHDPGKLTITNGTFTGTLYVRSQFSDVSISGGTFTGDIVKTGGTLSLTGGTYSVNPTAYVADTHIARKDSDTKFVVVEKANLTSGVYTSDPSSALAPGYVSYKNSDDTYTVYYPVPVTPGNTSSSTTKNPDGSTTTTTTDKTTGTVTETTKNPDGSTTTVETKKDGSVTETNKTANGSVGTVKSDANGNTEISANISAADVSAAAKKNEPVAAPVSVAPAASPAAAPVIKLSVPASAGEVSVVIPVTNAQQGTVAIKVNPDGTEEIIKTSVVTKDGVVLGVKGSAQIKIVNNDKDFSDTVGHWAESDVDFVSARELFTGTAPQTFSPESATTRGMVVTVLARLAGESTDGGANWYDKGCAWAVTNGVSDGTDPNGTVTREQLAAMLYRYFGSPAVSGSLSFADASSVSEYAHDAMQWCVNNGIINGMDGLLNPQGQATRAQVSAMFARYIRLMSTK